MPEADPLNIPQQGSPAGGATAPAPPSGGFMSQMAAGGGGKAPTPAMSVEKNLQGIYGSDNGIVSQARAAGQRMAAKRGLLNSSIAAGAGEDAALKSALPIAQQDAETSTRFGLQNLGF